MRLQFSKRSPAPVLHCNFCFLLMMALLCGRHRKLKGLKGHLPHRRVKPRGCQKLQSRNNVVLLGNMKTSSPPLPSGGKFARLARYAKQFIVMYLLPFPLPFFLCLHRTLNFLVFFPTDIFTVRTARYGLGLSTPSGCP